MSHASTSTRASTSALKPNSTDIPHLDPRRLERVASIYDQLTVTPSTAQAGQRSLSILAAKETFLAREDEFRSEPDSIISVNPSNPRLIQKDVDAVMSYVRKLKMAWIQQNAKQRYIKALMRDELVSAQENDVLRKQNEQRKRQLKEQKEHLRATAQQIIERGERLTQMYNTALDKAQAARDAAREILDTQVALGRLRAEHPGERWTINTASERLDQQVDQLQSLEDARKAATKKLAKADETIAVLTKDIDALRAKKKSAEETLAQLTRAQQDNIRVVHASEWVKGMIEHYHAMLGIRSVRAHTENELRITYDLNATATETTAQRKNDRTVTLQLVFQPNEPVLGSASLLDIAEPSAADQTWLTETRADLEGLIGECVQSNDVVGLVTGVRARIYGWGK